MIVVVDVDVGVWESCEEKERFREPRGFVPWRKGSDVGGRATATLELHATETRAKHGDLQIITACDGAVYTVVQCGH